MFLGILFIAVGLALLPIGVWAWRRGNARERERVTQARRYYDR